MGRDSLGEFEHQVLIARCASGPLPARAPVLLELEQRTGREVVAAVYIVLRRPEDKGLVSSL
ncbi:MAG: hypothetical protein L0271_12395 [Gemmatimonadetes bacterium]|nr:hypothetical protein [Gemmatimonadota bacterium]